jgi:hypothetical protein
MSLGSATRMAAPLVGTYLLSHHGYQATCLASGALLLALCVAMAALRPPPGRPVQAGGGGKVSKAR